MSSISEFIAFIATFSDEQKQEIQALLTETKVKDKVAKAKVVKAKVAKVKVDVTYTIDCEIPLASSYRISLDDINPKLCMARSFKIACDDKRWKPMVFREKQCASEPSDGSHLCAACRDRHDKFIETNKPKDWNGLIADEPPGHSHMLGTTWANEKKPKFVGNPVPVTTSDTSDESEAPAVVPAVAVIKVKKPRVKKVKVAAAADTVEVKKTQPAPKVEDVFLEFKTIDSELRLVHKINGNVYVLNEDTGEAGKYLGRKTFGDGLDTDALEVFDTESESD